MAKRKVLVNNKKALPFKTLVVMNAVYNAVSFLQQAKFPSNAKAVKYCIKYLHPTKVPQKYLQFVESCLKRAVSVGLLRLKRGNYEVIVRNNHPGK